VENIENVLNEWDSIESVDELDSFENKYIGIKTFSEIPVIEENTKESDIMITHIVGPEADRICEEAKNYLDENKNITVYQNIKKFSLDNGNIHIAILSYKSGS